MKTFIQFCEEKEPSTYDIGHYTKHKDMAQSELYHHGTVSGWDQINHLELYKKHRDAHERRTGYEMHPDDANHEAWVSRHRTKRISQSTNEGGDPEHFVQGRIDHKKKQYSINHSIPDSEDSTSETHQARVITRLIKKTRNTLAKKYPHYKEHDAKSTGVPGSFVHEMKLPVSKPNILQGLVNPRARRMRTAMKKSEVEQRPLKRHKAKYDAMENKVRKDLAKISGSDEWTTPTNAAT